MSPEDFVLQMSGVVRMVEDGQAPTTKQWNEIVELLGATIGPLVAKKMLAESEEEKRRKMLEEMNKHPSYAPNYNPLYTFNQQMLNQQMLNQHVTSTAKFGLAGIGTALPAGQISTSFVLGIDNT